MMRMPIPRNLIFDLDDTILDYSAPAEEVWKVLLPEFARRVGVPLERFRAAVNDSRRWYWSDPQRFRQGRLNQLQARRTFVRRAFDELGLSDHEASDGLADAFSRERETAVRPFPGAIEALETMREAGSSMALLTNGEGALQRAKIGRFRLDRFFRAVLIEGETGVGKPDSAAFHSALAALDAAPDSAWMIGDDLQYDIRPAAALGMKTAWVSGAETAKPDPAADIVIPSIEKLARGWTGGR
jgi:HAD superfamily hydrolase (TIGR01509 family)